MVRRGRRLGFELAAACLVSLLTPACPATPSPCAQPKSPAEQQVCDDCKTNLEIAPADLKQCAANSAGACEHVRKDLAQLVQLNAANKAGADEATSHLAACQGKGDDSADCKAAANALRKLSCE